MPYWSQEEERTLLKMLKEGKSIEEISEAFSRSVEAVILKARRLGVMEIPKKCRVTSQSQKEVKFQATTTTLPEIKPADQVISMEEMMKVMLGALDLMKNPAALFPLEIKRCRTIVSLARTYMNMLEKYEEWTYFEQKMVDMEARFLEMDKQSLQTVEDPAEKARLEQRIKEAEESLEEAKRLYGYEPFKKKPGLMSFAGSMRKEGPSESVGEEVKTG